MRARLCSLGSKRAESNIFYQAAQVLHRGRFIFVCAHRGGAGRNRERPYFLNRLPFLMYREMEGVSFLWALSVVSDEEGPFARLPNVRKVREGGEWHPRFLSSLLKGLIAYLSIMRLLHKLLIIL